MRNQAEKDLVVILLGVFCIGITRLLLLLLRKKISRET
jgi:hypothetical protein